MTVTQPRYVRTGQVTMMQARTYRGEARFVPSTEVNAIIRYALARAAQLTGVRLYEFVACLNHPHILSRDDQADRPAFVRNFHSIVARALNHHFGERDQVFSSRRYTDPVLLTPESVLERAVYINTNPVKHGYVRYIKDWGGVASFEMEYGVPVMVPRPEGFFSDAMPQEIPLTIYRPDDIAPELSDVEVRQMVRRQSLDRARELRGEFAATGRIFVGMKRIRRRSRRSAPNYGPLQAGRSAEIRPKVAGGTRKRRSEYLQEIKCFVESYGSARRAIREGKLHVVFPPGTYGPRMMGLRSEPP